MAGIDELITQLTDDSAPVSAAASPAALFLKWTLGAVLYIALALYISGMRGDLAVRFQSPLFFAEIAALATMLLTTFLSAATLSFPDVRQKQWLVWLPVVPVLAFVCILYVSWLNDVPPAPAPEHHFICLLCIALYSLLPAAVILYGLRRHATTHSRLTGAIALLSASSLGCLILRLSEETNSISHLIGWHYLPMIGFSILGLWLGRIWLKW